jgi:hypothetical protein
MEAHTHVAREAENNTWGQAMASGLAPPFARNSGTSLPNGRGPEMPGPLSILGA